jgi:hypothetical protein
MGIYFEINICLVMGKEQGIFKISASLAPPWTNVYFELQMNIYFRYHGENETKTWGVLKIETL